MTAVLTLSSGTYSMPVPQGLVGHLDGIPLLPPGSGAPPGLTLQIPVPTGTLLTLLENAAAAETALGAGSIVTSGTSGSFTIDFSDVVVTVTPPPKGSSQQQGYTLTLWPESLN
jgi:hypothetical protein